MSTHVRSSMSSALGLYELHPFWQQNSALPGAMFASDIISHEQIQLK